ncbi:hypothetical protein LTR37_013881 [Vermiconidia calcicola]|uniref:Uncharacterized protein n=1 Tax=Vermiconidia calcicola TaxID=1690605 RepID=A0ACC3MVT6_9PEZI|nr:hypothetical protein LTR37_013881 [Vermiconidia calcicola]
MATKPIHLYSHATGPNPWKVVILLEELAIPYETEFVDFSVIKEDPYISVNPNGRVPAIKDPNTDITLWESGAIIDYLLDTYDFQNQFRYTESPQKYEQKCWADFQMSGQGPYFGQKAWFTYFHSDTNITSAKERYGNEIKRVLGVINSHLEKTGNPYLVGDKVCYADLMFVPWNALVEGFLLGQEGFDWKAEFPKSYEWHQNLVARPNVKKMLEMKAKASEKK